MGAAKLNTEILPLENPDLFYLQAAEGWLELGNPAEAAKELGRVSTRQRSHPEVLHLRWNILARREQWDKCLFVARTIAHGYPNDPRSWITLAESFYVKGDFDKAYKVAALNAPSFPESGQLLYDAACYACLIGRFEEAKEFFHLATQMGGVPAKTRVIRRSRKSTSLGA